MRDLRREQFLLYSQKKNIQTSSKQNKHTPTNQPPATASYPHGGHIGEGSGATSEKAKRKLKPLLANSLALAIVGH